MFNGSAKKQIESFISAIHNIEKSVHLCLVVCDLKESFFFNLLFEIKKLLNMFQSYNCKL